MNPLKEIEQTELYKQENEAGIKVWRLRPLPVLMLIIMYKINEIVRTINLYEKASKR